jgi:ABC-type antimicrobial peptide transport system permease subunit
LGATRGQVIRLVLESGIRLFSVGLVLGLTAAAVLARFIRTLLYYVAPVEPSIYAAAAVLFTLIAVAACLLPSLRASRIDPIVALRAD